MKASDIPCLIFHWQATESLKHGWVCLVLTAAYRNRSLCSILMKSTWTWMADTDIQYFILCFVFDHGLCGQLVWGIYQLFSYRVPWFLSLGVLREIRHRSQPELLWESLFKKLLISRGLRWEKSWQTVHGIRKSAIHNLYTTMNRRTVVGINTELL